MKCRYCCKERKLIKAHIIPEGFFRRMRDGSDDLRLLSENQRDYPKRAPVGVYDATILCEDCELLFRDWDDYAQKLLGSEPKDARVVSQEGTVVGYEIPQYRYDLLKLFFISVLWRASVSIHEFYRKVNLGPYEGIAKRLLDVRDPGAAQEFAVILAKFDDHSFAEAMFGPFREKVHGITYYRFYLAWYVAYIKTDGRSAPKEFLDCLLAPEGPLRIILRDLRQSPELPRMHRIVTAPRNRPKTYSPANTSPV
jgi:hypothetical protein